MAATLTPEFDAAAILARVAFVPGRITADSRQVRVGDAFAAYQGATVDGRAFIGDAVARGASLVLWDAIAFRWNSAWDVANIAIDDLKSKLGAIAARIYGYPSRALWVVGVTGTNGKTTCTHWIARCLGARGRRTGIVGTLGNGFPDALRTSTNTTPDAAVVQETLALLKDAGAQAIAMEVSSHGLDQGRVNAVEFDVALFTNLSRDHLDYHGTMAAYGDAKSKLFAWPTLKARVVNIDDPYGRGLADTARSRGQPVLTYGLGAADVVATRHSAVATGIDMAVATPWGRGDVALRVSGAFNVSNALGVLGVLLASGIGLDDALAALAEVTAPPGRMQRLGGGAQPLVVIDYAHTPDALRQALLALRPAVAAAGRLVCVFGCGGDRDKGKRPEMGRVAVELADCVVVTSDNPRSEDPATIVDAIVRGIPQTLRKRSRVQLDRGTAIRAAIGEAREGDVVLVAGKGHEAYQETNGMRVAFSDAETAAAALAGRGAE